MNQRTTLILALAGATVVAATAVFTPGCTCGSKHDDNVIFQPSGRVKHVKEPENPVKAEYATYHGWSNSIRLANAFAEVVIVPEIGRVMSFRHLDGQNVFWEDRALDGKRGDASGKQWMNFGGDKTWPAPEADWSRHTGQKEWMPPTAFDSLPVTARIVSQNVVELTSPVDPHYGIQTRRRISLTGGRLEITTTYEHVANEERGVGIWVITQFKDPVAICVPAGNKSIFNEGYIQFDNLPWSQIKRRGSFIEITRDKRVAHKMGSDAKDLLWIGEREICHVSGEERFYGNPYFDRGSSVEVYTNPDPKKYVELETLGWRGADSFKVKYTLYRREGMSVEEAASRYLGKEY